MSGLICRLCLGEGIPLFDIYATDGDFNLNDMANICIGVEIHPGDCLPSVICENCKKKLRNFFAFKQKCLNVEMKLKALNQTALERTLGTNHSYHKDLPHTTVNKNKQEIERAQIEISEKNNVTEIDQSNIFQCEQCGRRYKAKINLERHLMSHLGKKLFPCKLCPKKYTRYEHLKVHMRSHFGFRPYICEICGSSSTKQQDLSRHMKIHSDERNYACPTCDRRFKRSSDISSHMRTHTGVRPYICSVCGKTYVSHSGLRKHLISNCQKLSSSLSIH